MLAVSLIKTVDIKTPKDTARLDKLVTAPAVPGEHGQLSAVRWAAHNLR